MKPILHGELLFLTCLHCQKRGLRAYDDATITAASLSDKVKRFIREFHLSIALCEACGTLYIESAENGKVVSFSPKRGRRFSLADIDEQLIIDALKVLGNGKFRSAEEVLAEAEKRRRRRLQREKAETDKKEGGPNRAAIAR